MPAEAAAHGHLLCWPSTPSGQRHGQQHAALAVYSSAYNRCLQRVSFFSQGVRFKRVIMDESSTDRSWDPPKQTEFKRIVFCSGKVRPCLPGLRLSCTMPTPFFGVAVGLRMHR